MEDFTSYGKNDLYDVGDEKRAFRNENEIFRFLV